MVTIGEKLRYARQKLDLTISEVSVKTKIRPHILTAIEEGNYSIVPSVYAKSFIVTYAQLVKLPESEYTNDLNQLFRTVEKPPKYEPTTLKEAVASTLENKFAEGNIFRNNLGKDFKFRLVNFLIYFFLGLGLFLLIYFSFFRDSEKKTISAISTSDKKKMTQDSSVIKPQSKNLLSFYENPDSLILEVRAFDTSWIKIDIDGKMSENHYMKPGFTKRWSALGFFLLTVGNAGGVEFKRNGKVVGPLGEKGSVARNIKITSKDITNPATQWSKSDTSSQRRILKKRLVKAPPPKMLEPAPFKPVFKNPYEKKKQIEVPKTTLQLK